MSYKFKRRLLLILPSLGLLFIDNILGLSYLILINIILAVIEHREKQAEKKNSADA
jgi:hypothetical protein